MVVLSLADWVVAVIPLANAPVIVLFPKAIVLLVKVCDPVRVVTVESIAKVAVVPVPLESIPVPPVSIKASEFKSTSKLPESVCTSKSSALIWEFT